MSDDKSSHLQGYEEYDLLQAQIGWSSLIEW